MSSDEQQQEIRMSRVRTFCLTVNNWDESSIIGLKSVENISFGLLCEEEGESGTPHLQGYVQLHKKQSLSALQKSFKKAGVKCAAFVAKGSSADNIRYCRKDKGVSHEWGELMKMGARSDLAKIRDMIEGGESDQQIVAAFPGDYFRYGKAFARYRKVVEQGEIMDKCKEEMKEARLRPWQERVLEQLLAQCDREVLWIVDYVGNTGKSFLSKYLAAIHGAFEVTGGKTQDIAYAYEYESIVVFDLSRQKQEYVNYGVIEDFKNGRIFSPKYESKTLRFVPAKVIVFSNWDPDETKLSEDRWKIILMGEKPVVDHVFSSGFHFKPGE